SLGFRSSSAASAIRRRTFRSRRVSPQTRPSSRRPTPSRKGRLAIATRTPIPRAPPGSVTEGITIPLAASPPGRPDPTETDSGRVVIELPGGPEDEVRPAPAGLPGVGEAVAVGDGITVGVVSGSVEAVGTVTGRLGSEVGRAVT